MRLSVPAARKIIRQAAADTARVSFTLHALRRMRQRKITRRQVMQCLQQGVITEEPAPDRHGNWACHVERLVAGDPTSVAVVIEGDGSLIVITAFAGSDNVPLR